MSILDLGEGSLIASAESQTLELGRRVGALLLPGEAVFLKGDLGAGKTCLTRGIAEGLDVPEGERVRSPSFSLVNVYRGRFPLYHVDLYRLSEGSEISALGLEELWDEGCVVVEWAERLQGIHLPKSSLWISLDHGSSPSERLIRWSCSA